MNHAALEKRISRRNILKGVAGITVLATAGGVFRANQVGVFDIAQGAPYEAWVNWKDETLAGPMAVVQAGLLAANPHNTQPWIFEVLGNQINLFADTSRHLGTMDVYGREMYIGLGCALENMHLAAQREGMSANIEMISGSLLSLKFDGSAVKVATVTLLPNQSDVSPEQDALLSQIAQRHTNRANYYRDQVLSDEQLIAMQALESDTSVQLKLYRDEDSLADISALTVDATKAIIADPVMAHDSSKWFRASRQMLDEHRDGPYIDNAGLNPAMRTISKMMPPISEDASNQYWLSQTQNTMASTPLLGLILVNDLYDKVQALLAGRLWQRTHLWATKQGIAMQPVNQMCEVVDRERQKNGEMMISKRVKALVNNERFSATFVFRAGFAVQGASPSARRAIADVTLDRR